MDANIFHSYSQVNIIEAVRLKFKLSESLKNFTGTYFRTCRKLQQYKRDN